MTAEEVEVALALCASVPRHGSIEIGCRVGCPYCFEAHRDEAAAVSGDERIQSVLAKALAEISRLRSLCERACKLGESLPGWRGMPSALDIALDELKAIRQSIITGEGAGE